MPGPMATMTDMFATPAFSKLLFARIRKVAHASLTADRLFITIETRQAVPEAWLLTLLCKVDAASLKGAAPVERVRFLRQGAYQLITRIVADSHDDLIPLPKGSMVTLITRNGDHVTHKP